MKILIVCHSFPFPHTTNAISFRIFNLVKHLSEKYGHNITIIAFYQKDNPKQYLEKYCDEIMTVELPVQPEKRYMYYITNYMRGLMYGDISFQKKNIFDYNFSWEMQRKIKELLRTKDFDVIFVDDFSMVPYVSNVSLPKILTEIGNIPEVHYEAYRIERNIFKKASRVLLYLIAKNHERSYKNFDAVIVTTEHVKDTLESHLSNLHIYIVPFGVDIDLRFENSKEDFPSLLFLGTLGSIFNQRAVLYLYYEIYPLIKKQIPDLKLYIVGKDPPETILKLAADDSSVIITGYVKDIKPYLARSSIITLPIHGFGIKTRLLEAMAIGKPVIISSEGIRGIDASPEENIITADDPKEFAERVIELLHNEALRKKIGANARKLMEEKYSWEKMADMLNEISNKVIYN
jgi:glycosyltransferase involved in cell wall biosynthesis